MVFRKTQNTIFKKGNKSQCKHYRGISILSCLPKLYDGILNTRFTQWYKPDIEQAGGQTGRGCEEQIMTIRLLIDTARKIGETLYIAFLDYAKAYDKVNRSKLLSMLATRGCGANFLSALTHMLRNTTNIIGSHYSRATAGVKQGSPTSSSLFNFYINDTITRIKQHQPDGFLKELHILLFMDDTVILATSRQTMIDKLNTVYKASSELDMILHPTKSKYITVNTDDDLPFHIGPVTISYTTNYLYLEAQISNKLMQEQVKLHSQNKQCHVTKFVSFLKNNTDAPFSVKKKVWESALTSSMLYSCETWLTHNLSSIATQFNSTLKDLLGVRQQTPTDLALIEIGAIPTKDKIKIRQMDYISKITTSSHYQNSPLSFAISIAQKAKSPMGKYLTELLQIDKAIYNYAKVQQKLKENVLKSTSSRSTAYSELNPDMSVHLMYYPTSSIPEIHRIATTRLRLSHKLKIETGRWSRTPREERLCTCGSDIQKESHVLNKCPLIQHIREQYAIIDLTSAATAMNSQCVKELCQLCFRIMDLYNH